MRDSVMRAKRDTGKDVLDMGEKGAEIVDVFGYDAEDDAENHYYNENVNLFLTIVCSQTRKTTYSKVVYGAVSDVSMQGAEEER